MSVSYSYFTGRPDNILTSTIRRISAYTRNSRNFKIGISNNPDRRWCQAHKFFYDDMIVLYGSSSIDNVSALEVALIDQYGLYCDNLIRGGGGNIGQPPYFLYLVRKRWN